MNSLIILLLLALLVTCEVTCHLNGYIKEQWNINKWEVMSCPLYCLLHPEPAHSGGNGSGHSNQWNQEEDTYIQSKQGTRALFCGSISHFSVYFVFTMFLCSLEPTVIPLPSTQTVMYCCIQTCDLRYILSSDERVCVISMLLQVTPSPPSFVFFCLCLCPDH